MERIMDILNANEDLIDPDTFDDPDDELMHYGVKRRSGRYPWGSGINPYQHEAFFMGFKSLVEEGLNEKQIAERWEISTKTLREMKSIAGDCARRQKVAEVKSLKKDGYSNSEIARRLGYPSESSVRALLDEKAESKMNVAKNTADFLRNKVDAEGMIDIGKGVETQLGVSREKLDEAIFMLEIEGYEKFGAGVKQATDRTRQTTIEVIAPPGTKQSDVYDFDKIHTLDEYHSTDNGETFWKMEYPAKLKSDRILILFVGDKDEKGVLSENKDGLVEIRRGCEDLSLGDSRYAQVRIMCDGEKYGLEGNRYIKGMAVYSDNLPEGIDVRINSSKIKENVGRVLKPCENDPINPFGSTIMANGQYHYRDKDGKEQLGLINKKNEEGSWDTWSKTLPSQFLSKQRKELVQSQLALSVEEQKAELERIKQLDNVAIKRKLLMTYASQCDGKAVSLAAASLPRQRYLVILPCNSLKANEIYAPNYKDGEKVALVRYPHGGVFEIPILTVNNKNKEAIEMIGKNSIDAVAIPAIAAKQLSGADFDGDTAMVIPTGGKVDILSKKYYEELKNFDPHVEYAKHPGMKTLKKSQVGNEMGQITNLITDMTAKGADDAEIVRAVKHSMVIIDAYKHELDYKQSFADNRIQDLKEKYQAHVNPKTGRISYGAGTIVSRAGAQASIPKRQGSGIIDRETGEMIYKESGRLDTRTGKPIMLKTTQMASTKNAFDLVSDNKNPIEVAYANYANALKQLANDARKEAVNSKGALYSSEAAKKYAVQVKTLQDKYDAVMTNKPRERKAQLLANTWLDAKLRDNPSLKEDKEKYGKEAQKLLVAARNQVGSKRNSIDITPEEWEAIQAGAISTSRLSEMLNYADIDKVRQYATPREDVKVKASDANLIRAMFNAGYTNAEIAERFGVSVSTIIKYKEGA